MQCLRKKQKLLPSTNLQLQKINQSFQEMLRRCCLGHFGFLPSTKKKLGNIRKVIGDVTLLGHHENDTNMKCHDSCTGNPRPTNTTILLGLGSKFCFQSRKLDLYKHNETIERLKHGARNKIKKASKNSIE